MGRSLQFASWVCFVVELHRGRSRLRIDLPHSSVRRAVQPPVQPSSEWTLQRPGRRLNRKIARRRRLSGRMKSGDVAEDPKQLHFATRDQTIGCDRQLLNWLQFRELFRQFRSGAAIQRQANV